MFKFVDVRNHCKMFVGIMQPADVANLVFSIHLKGGDFDGLYECTATVTWDQDNSGYDVGDYDVSFKQNGVEVDSYVVIGNIVGAHWVSAGAAGTGTVSGTI
jgi:hypothetical protein